MNSVPDEIDDARLYGGVLLTFVWIWIVGSWRIRIETWLNWGACSRKHSISSPKYFRRMNSKNHFTWFGFQVSSNIWLIWLWTISSLFQTFFKTTRIALRMRPSLSNTVRVMSSMSSGSGHDYVWVIQPLIHWLKHILLWEIFELTKIPLVPTLVGLKIQISYLV